MKIAFVVAEFNSEVTAPMEQRRARTPHRSELKSPV